MTTSFLTVDAAERRAAQIGPGYKGVREDASPEERQALADAFRSFGREAPAFLEQETTWIERKAKLFEAGDFPDKGVKVEIAHLQNLAANFDLPAPVLIEHAQSPLQLGYLTSVEVVGTELHGTIALTAEADGLVQKSKARKLSLGLAPDLSSIREVSIVRNPRVKDARLFRFCTNFEPDWQSQCERLAQDEVNRRVADYIRQGRLMPAQAAFARALLACDDPVMFDDETSAVGLLVTQLIESLPVRVRFEETVPAKPFDYSEQLMLPEEVAFYRRHFPDIALDQIAARR